MKKLVVACTLLLNVVALSAQQKFGIATYTVPDGWQLTEQASSVTMETKSRGGICKITIFATEKGAVSTTADYTSYRSSLGMANITYAITRAAITRNEADGLVSFSSYGTGTLNGRSFRNYFYSVSNGKQTYFVQLTASDNTCVTTFNTFLTNLLVDPSDDSNTDRTQTRARRKSAPAAPAAPAPMM